MRVDDCQMGATTHQFEEIFRFPQHNEVQRVLLQMQCYACRHQSDW